MTIPRQGKEGGDVTAEFEVGSASEPGSETPAVGARRIPLAAIEAKMASLMQPQVKKDWGISLLHSPPPQSLADKCLFTQVFVHGLNLTHVGI